MTIDNGDKGFQYLLHNLQRQIMLLKERCTAAEAEIATLREANRQQQERIGELEVARKALAEKYDSLQAGAAQGASAEAVETLRDRYLAMIREIDLCLDKLNG